MRQATRVGSVLMGAVFALMMVVSGESAGGVPDGITGDDGNAACPVVRGMAPQGVALRLSTEHAPLAPEFPMSPAASCGQSAQSAPALQAQVSGRWGVCRLEGYWCYLREPMYQGEECCCYRGDGVLWFCGIAWPN